jgi:peptidoglycan/LPS O-acetylase OafA/YrhL
MADAIIWFVLFGLVVYTALRTPKFTPFMRAMFLCLAFAIAILEIVDLRGGHPGWINWTLLFVVVVFGFGSFMRTRQCML